MNILELIESGEHGQLKDVDVTEYIEDHLKYCPRRSIMNCVIDPSVLTEDLLITYLPKVRGLICYLETVPSVDIECADQMFRAAAVTRLITKQDVADYVWRNRMSDHIIWAISEDLWRQDWIANMPLYLVPFRLLTDEQAVESFGMYSIASAKRYPQLAPERKTEAIAIAAVRASRTVGTCLSILEYVTPITDAVLDTYLEVYANDNIANYYLSHMESRTVERTLCDIAKYGDRIDPGNRGSFGHKGTPEALEVVVRSYPHAWFDWTRDRVEYFMATDLHHIIPEHLRWRQGKPAI